VLRAWEQDGVTLMGTTPAPGTGRRSCTNQTNRVAWRMDRPTDS